MQNYTQLSLEERCSIARLHEDGQSIRQIAATLDRQPATIARELKRNTGRKIGYQPAYAQSLTAARRWTGNKLERDDALRLTVLKCLTAGWSPEQIAGRLAREAGHKIISHETIYRFVYAQLKRTNDTKWRLYLPRAKIKRGWRTKGGWPRTDGKCSIHDRPAHIAERQTLGHWEADCMLFSKLGPAILVAHERHSRSLSPCNSPASRPIPSRKALSRCSNPSHQTCANPSPSTTAPSSTDTKNSLLCSTFRPTSAIHTRHGKKAASKTPLDASDARSPEKPISLHCQKPNSTPSSQITTTHPENASAS